MKYLKKYEDYNFEDEYSNADDTLEKDKYYIGKWTSGMDTIEYEIMYYCPMDEDDIELDNVYRIYPVSEWQGNLGPEKGEFEMPRDTFENITEEEIEKIESGEIKVTYNECVGSAACPGHEQVREILKDIEQKFNITIFGYLLKGSGFIEREQYTMKKYNV